MPHVHWFEGHIFEASQYSTMTHKFPIDRTYPSGNSTPGTTHFPSHRIESYSHPPPFIDHAGRGRVTIVPRTLFCANSPANTTSKKTTKTNVRIERSNYNNRGLFSLFMLLPPPLSRPHPTRWLMELPFGSDENFPMPLLETQTPKTGSSL